MEFAMLQGLRSSPMIARKHSRRKTQAWSWSDADDNSGFDSISDSSGSHESEMIDDFEMKDDDDGQSEADPGHYQYKLLNKIEKTKVEKEFKAIAQKIQLRRGKVDGEKKKPRPRARPHEIKSLSKAKKQDVMRQDSPPSEEHLWQIIEALEKERDAKLLEIKTLKKQIDTTPTRKRRPIKEPADGDDDEETWAEKQARAELDGMKRWAKTFSRSGRPRSRSSELLEWELEEKREKEEMELKVRFKARPIPASTLMPRYEKMVEAAKARSLARRKERAEKLSETINPFRGVEFRAAKQVAKRRERQAHRERMEEIQRASMSRTSRVSSAREGNSETFQERMKREEEERKARREKHALELLEESKLPPRMALHEETEKTKELYGAKKVKTDELECTFKPKINTTVPDFNQTKKNWMRALAKARQSARTTKPQIDHLRMFSRDAIQREHDKHQKTLAKHRAEEPRKSKRAKSLEAFRRVVTEKTPTVQMTKSQELRLRKIAAAKRTEIEARKQQELAEREKRERMARAREHVRAMVNKAEAERRAQTGYLTLEEAERKAKIKAKQLNAQWREKMRQEKHRLAQPRTNQPMLFERNSEDLRKTKRRQQALVRVAAAVFQQDKTIDILDEEEQLQVDLDAEIEENN